MLLSVENLTVEIEHQGKITKQVEGVSFQLMDGETLALVGESGSGKTLTALAIMGLLPAKARLLSGDICFEGQSISAKGEQAIRQLRGKKIAMIFQEPTAAFNPVFTIGTQITDIIRRHVGTSAAQAKTVILDLFTQVGLADSERVFQSYPHQLSGGMAQRCMIAMALSCKPKFIIADEPTTALDVTTQQQILKLFVKLQYKYSFALLLVSHDLKVVATMADRIAVMKDGKILELNTTRNILSHPKEKYTALLLSSDMQLQCCG